MSSKSKALVRRVAAAVVGVPLLMSAFAPAARADTVVESAQARVEGAWAAATMKQKKNGAVYATVNVGDSAADGLCAHGVIRWHHVNGSTYDDYGMWLCGAYDETDEPFRVPVRDWRAYEAIEIGAFVDGGTPVYTTILRWGDRNDLHRQANRAMGMTYREFARYKNRIVQWPLNWNTNGCNVVRGWPKRFFDKACEQHDFGYRNYGKYMRFGRNDRTRRWIDERFVDEMYRTCDDHYVDGLPRWKSCIDAADSLWAGVRTGARSHFYG
jgi:Prokaryotic phospholipase A2